jgi:hypothetical protein
MPHVSTKGVAQKKILTQKDATRVPEITRNQNIKCYLVDFIIIFDDFGVLGYRINIEFLFEKFHLD